MVLNHPKTKAIAFYLLLQSQAEFRTKNEPNMIFFAIGGQTARRFVQAGGYKPPFLLMLVGFRSWRLTLRSFGNCSKMNYCRCCNFGY
jgi:hypothetical protein